MSHPLQKWAGEPFGETFYWLTVAFAIVTSLAALAMQPLALQLKLKAASMFSFEFCWNASRANEIVEGWRRNELLDVGRKLLRIDYALIVGYANLLALLSLAAARTLVRANWWGVGSYLGEIGLLFAWAVWVAGVFDVIENMALERILNNAGGMSIFLPRLASISASVKWLVVVICALYVLLAILTPLASRRSQ